MNNQAVTGPHMSEPIETHATVAKAATAWGGVGLANLGIHNWSDAAAVVATIYTLILICEWCWKKFLRRWIRGK